jgi:hypothetical protein
VLGQTLAGDAAAAGQAGRLPGGWRQPGGRVQALGRGEAADRQAVGSEAGRPHDGNAGQAGEDLAGGLGQQLGELGFDLGDVGLQGLVAGTVTAKPLGA